MIEVSRSRVAVALTVFVVVLSVLSVSGHALQYFYGTEHFTEYVRLFNISGEANVAAWFSSFTLAICAALLLGIALANKKVGASYTGHWMGLAAGFLYMSVDETAQIHEILIVPVRTALNTSGIFRYAWVIPGIAIVLVVAALYFPFLLRLPSRTRGLFLLAGALYLSGALGMELVSGYVAEYMGDQVIVRGLVATLEEILEHAGVIVFIYALMSYFASYIQDTQIKWKP